MKNYFFFGSIALLCLAFYACQKSNDVSGSSSQLKIRMTDAPYNAQQVNVDLREVVIKYKKDSSWTTLTTNAGIYNLLQFQNGLDTLIASGGIPTNSIIKEVRLILGPNNSIMIDSVVYPLLIPSGSESGLKIKVDKKLNRSIEDILLDFDANLSIHQTGAGQYKLKPVIKLK